MIEKIREEISQVLFNIDTTALEAGIAQRQIFEILDKYKNQPDYKNAYEELKKMYINGGFPNYVYEREVTMQELEQKHNIERNR